MVSSHVQSGPPSPAMRRISLSAKVMACFSVTDTSVFSGSLPPRPIQSSTSTASKDTASTAIILPAFMIEPPFIAHSTAVCFLTFTISPQQSQ